MRVNNGRNSVNIPTFPRSVASPIAAAKSARPPPIHGHGFGAGGKGRASRMNVRIAVAAFPLPSVAVTATVHVPAASKATDASEPVRSVVAPPDVNRQTYDAPAGNAGALSVAGTREGGGSPPDPGGGAPPARSPGRGASG